MLTLVLSCFACDLSYALLGLVRPIVDRVGSLHISLDGLLPLLLLGLLPMSLLLPRYLCREATCYQTGISTSRNVSEHCTFKRAHTRNAKLHFCLLE